MTDEYKQYENVSLDKIRTQCDVCQNNDLVAVIDWQQFPFTELYVAKELKIPKYFACVDLALDFCPNCSHAQLRNVVDQNVLYGDISDYAFRSSISQSAKKSYEFFLDYVYRTLKSDSVGNILEVGCNDLYMVKYNSASFHSYTGVDPILSKLTDLKVPDNCNLHAEFFENVDLQETPDVVICKDVLEHVVDPKLFMEKLVAKGNDNTTFFVQIPILETIIANRRFDQVFHQHLNYFTVHSFIELLKDLGCALIDYEINHHHWAVGIFSFKKGNNSFTSEKTSLKKLQMGLQAFNQRMEATNDAIKAISENGDIYLYGAGLMLSVYSYHIPSYHENIIAIIDDNEYKQNQVCLHLPLPIVSINDVNNITECSIVFGAVSSRENVVNMTKTALGWNARNLINPVLLT